MKKLLILMLVLGITSAANAVIVGSYSLYVNTAPPSPTYVPGEWVEGVDSEVVLYPSDTLWIGVHNSVAGVAGATQKDTFMLGIIQPAEGPSDTSWTEQWLVYKPPLVAGAPVPENIYYGIQDYFGDGSLIVDMWQLNLTDGNPATLQGVGILDAKELHCDFGPSEDTIILLNMTSGVIEDTLLIHQLPEPMTIMLLGLGGLLLRRRK